MHSQRLPFQVLETLLSGLDPSKPVTNATNSQVCNFHSSTRTCRHDKLTRTSRAQNKAMSNLLSYSQPSQAWFPTIGAPMPAQMQHPTSQSPSCHTSAATHEETFAHQFAEVQGASQAHAVQQTYFDPTMEDQLPLPAVPMRILQLQFRPNASFQYIAYFNGLRMAYQQFAVLSAAYGLLGDEYHSLPLSVRNTWYLPFFQRAFARDSFMIQPNGALPMPLMLLRMIDEALEAMADALEVQGGGESIWKAIAR